MEIAIFLVSIILVIIYIFRPITKTDEQHFRNKNNWRGGF